MTIAMEGFLSMTPRSVRQEKLRVAGIWLGSHLAVSCTPCSQAKDPEN